jgi:farnesyl-diphosphate farnesyltransferase
MSNAASRSENERRLFEALKDVSRSFYLTMRILPQGVRHPIGLAYAVARAADTISDTTAMAPEVRLEHLLSLRRVIEQSGDIGSVHAIVEALTAQEPSDRDRRLFELLPDALKSVDSLEPTDSTWVRAIVVALSRGMEFDLSYFPTESSGQIRALADWEALDEYTYLVAGCVGEFWTAVTMFHEPKLNRWDGQRMSEIGVRFGKALQLTNILRDVPSDLRIGRIYLPQSALIEAGVRPPDLFDPKCAEAARTALVAGIRLALDHYAAAFEYFTAIPRSCVRLRLAAAWPILIGLGTLHAIASNAAWLDPARPSRVSRGWIKRMVGVSAVGVRSNSFMRPWFDRLKRQVERAL